MSIQSIHIEITHVSFDMISTTSLHLEINQTDHMFLVFLIIHFTAIQPLYNSSLYNICVLTPYHILCDVDHTTQAPEFTPSSQGNTHVVWDNWYLCEWLPDACFSVIKCSDAVSALSSLYLGRAPFGNLWFPAYHQMCCYPMSPCTCLGHCSSFDHKLP